MNPASLPCFQGHRMKKKQKSTLLVTLSRLHEETKVMSRPVFNQLERLKRRVRGSEELSLLKTIWPKEEHREGENKNKPILPERSICMSPQTANTPLLGCTCTSPRVQQSFGHISSAQQIWSCGEAQVRF